MREELYYTCEICGYTSSNKKDVERCEASGFPAIEYSHIDLTKEVILYGKYEKTYSVKVLGVLIENTMGYPCAHNWVLRIDREVDLADCDWGPNHGNDGFAYDYYLKPRW